MKKIPTKIGQKSITYTDTSRNRPIVTEIWYPTNDALIEKDSTKDRKNLFKAINTIPYASISDDKFPLLLVSHGTGERRSYCCFNRSLWKLNIQ